MKGLISPHILLASSNPMRMIQNLNHLLDQQELAKLQGEIERNVKQLFALGQSHFDFAVALRDEHWRQKISRLYYAVYNARRAVSLRFDGSFSTDSSDHKSVGNLPPSMTDKEQHSANLRTLREDRNLADYSHYAQISDLVMPLAEATEFAKAFLNDCREFLEQAD